jgi:hypothetical protein
MILVDVRRAFTNWQFGTFFFDISDISDISEISDTKLNAKIAQEAQSWFLRGSTSQTSQ